MNDGTETLERWTRDRQMVTDGGRAGRVIGYVTHPGEARAQIALTTGGIAWEHLLLLRPLGLRRPSAPTASGGEA